MESRGDQSNWRILLVYGVALALIAGALEWLEFRYFTRQLPTQWYVVVIALLFAAVGVWTGWRLTRRSGKSDSSQLNKEQLAALSKRELACLELLCQGLSNKAIAKALNVSPNTIKTQLASVYRKLGVNSRVEAVAAATQAFSVDSTAG